MIESVELIAGSWEAVGHLAAPVRATVFIGEQGVPKELEWDGEDETALHVVAVVSTGEAVGTVRLLPNGHIGRMAVLREWRGRGVGRRILERIVRAARERGHAEVVLAAQLHAIAFYERLGFTAYGGVFDDAGIDHRMMRREFEAQ